MSSVRLGAMVIASVAMGGCATAGPVRVADVAPAKPTTRLSVNQKAAARDAAALLLALQLPAGATRLTQEPNGDHSWLKPVPAILGSSARVDMEAWWKLPGSPRSAYDYIQSHPPTGATRFETGTETDSSGDSALTVGYQWEVIRGVMTTRILQVTVTGLPGGGTGLLAEAQSDWYVPRPVSERVPQGVKHIELTAGAIGKPPTVARTLSSVTTVDRIIKLIDSMPVVQPNVVGCPAEMTSGARVIALAFIGAASQQLAEANYDDYAPLRTPSGPCKPITFTVHHILRMPLIGGRFVAQLERIVGFSVTR